MTSSADANRIETLNYVSEQLNRYLSPVIFTFGTIGNILNCLVLSQRTLRSNSCALLFLVSSFVDLISIVFGLTTRIMAGWNHDPTATIGWICKLRAFIVFSTRTMAMWFITLATIDRWLLSSIDIHRRQMGTLKNVKRGIIASLILSILSYVHMLYCYEANMLDQPLKCYGKTVVCRFITDLTYLLISIAIPLILMVTFGLMTISNVHHVQTRVQHVVRHSNNNRRVAQNELQTRRTDNHLLRMLLVQVFLLSICSIPQAIQKFYMTFKPFSSGSDLEDVITIFAYNIEVLLAFIASGMPFYIYTLAGGRVFRNGLVNLIETIHQKLTCHFY